MSANPMEDAKPDAVAGADHILPADITANSAETGGTRTADRPPVPQAATEPAADPEPVQAAEPDGEPETEPAPEAHGEAETEPAPEAHGEAASERDGESPEPADTAGTAESAPDEVLATAHPADLNEPAELMEMSEPVELAEPVEPAGEGRPKRRLWLRLLIGVVFLLLGGAIIGGAFAIVGSLTHGFKKPVIITYKKSAIFSLRTGECIDPHGQQAASLVPCATAHAAEVFATFTLPAAKWPGEAAVRTAASSGCATRLAGYLNPQLAISLATTYVYPDQIAWQQGTRKVTCEVRATSGDLTGSVRAAAAR